MSINTSTQTDNLALDDLLTFGQATAASGLTYWQLDHAAKTDAIKWVRLEEGGRRLLVRSSLDEFVKLREQKKKARHLDTPSDKDKSNTKRAGKEVL